MAEKNPEDRLTGYWASAVVFAGITALWAFVVREDEFYNTMDVFGVSLPVTTVFYLLTMPLLGFVAGMWRYHASGGGGAQLLGKAIARAFNFVYSHLLIVLFTVAMATEYFLGWNLDAAVENIDDGLFVVASRFAPWLAAYLAGFNFGRAIGVTRWRRRNHQRAAVDPAAPHQIGAVAEPPIAAERGEPVFAETGLGAGAIDRSGLGENPFSARKAGPALAHDDGPMSMGFRRDPGLEDQSTAQEPGDWRGAPAANKSNGAHRGAGFSKPAALADFQEKPPAQDLALKRPSFERLR